MISVNQKQWGLVIGLGLLGVAAGVAVYKGVKANNTYEPTELESLQLEVLQKDAILYQSQLNQIQGQFNDAVQKLNAKADEIKKAHGWPEATQFNPGTRKFSAPPLPSANSQVPAKPGEKAKVTK